MPAIVIRQGETMHHIAHGSLVEGHLLLPAAFASAPVRCRRLGLHPCWDVWLLHPDRILRHILA